MSQHNIIGSEAFRDRRYVLVRNVRSGLGRRRRSRPVLAYAAVAVLALSAGAAAAAFALGPLVVEEPAGAAAPAPGGALRLQPAPLEDAAPAV